MLVLTGGVWSVRGAEVGQHEQGGQKATVHRDAQAFLHPEALVTEGPLGMGWRGGAWERT